MEKILEKSGNFVGGKSGNPARNLLVFKVETIVLNSHLLQQKLSFNKKLKNRYFQQLIFLSFSLFVEYERHPAKIDETIAPKAM